MYSRNTGGRSFGTYMALQELGEVAVLLQANLLPVK
jgi:hypothetical protein